MKKFVYTSHCFDRVHFGAPVDKMLEEKSKGHEMYWGFCKGALSSCENNISGNCAKCMFCHLLYSDIIKKYGKNINIIPIDRKSFVNSNHKFEYTDSNDIRKLKYRGVEVGLSILSNYYTVTRDFDCVITSSFRTYFDKLSSEICSMIDSIYNLFDRIKPEEVIIFNGRLYENRLFYDISQELGLSFVSAGTVGEFGKEYWKAYRVEYHDVLPHNMDFWAKKSREVWDMSEESEEEKIKKASSFFENRRKGILTIDWKAYTKDQIMGLLPQGFDKSKQNIAIFNSSPDEYASIGGEWDENLLFKSQYEAICFLLETAPTNTHFYLRIHPNMKDVTYSDHLKLYKLPNYYSNITVIEPSSKISSYSLLDACDKVFTFGSTMGLEATYWGKPSILIGHSFYSKLDVCYIPQDKRSIKTLLNNPLPSKDKIEALKYAYILLDTKYFPVKNSFFDINYKSKKIFGKEFNYVPYLTVFGSHVLYRLTELIIRIVSKLSPNYNTFPKSKK